MTKRCVPCRQGLTCINEPPCQVAEEAVKKDADQSSAHTGNEPEDSDNDVRPSNRAKGRASRRGAYKRDAVLRDPQSTGRKRAATLYPLAREEACEWRDKANCGGGLFPIVGCVSGLQQARHHGPDKSVVNNEEGNVHRICHRCHARWHAANNADYEWTVTTVNPHRPVAMTDEQRLKTQKEKSQKYERIKD